MSGARRKTVHAKGAPVVGHPDERGITFRVSNDHFERIKTIAVENRRSISQECAWRVMASIEAEDKAK